MDELPKAYNPTDHEASTYKRWEESGYFNPDNLPDAKKRKPFTISMPPTNATGILHIGHAAGFTIQDILTRFQRMRGRRSLWLPGTDHAAIATQNVVEKELKKEGVSRHDLGRDAFLQRVEQFVQSKQGTIREQTKHLGASCDWSRERFTLDEGLSDAVRTAFVRMYEDGLIYRGTKVVNWCIRDHSTLADDEVEHEEKQTTLYTFRYDKNFPILIATTRPETKFGDTAVAVNPSDDRYKQYVGKEFTVHFAGVERTIRIVADRAVDKDFGTGALGVTPAHSAIDEAIALREKLPSIVVIDKMGKMTAEAGELAAGLKAIAAREKVVDWLRNNELLEKEEPITHNLSVCYRCNTPIEPMPLEQWFVAVDRPTKTFGGKSLKDYAKEVVEKKDITLIPDRFTNVYTRWMDNLHDWCISRQIWYGHRIPVWYKRAEKGVTILFLRHGQTDANISKTYAGHNDIPLNDQGRRDIVNLAESTDLSSVDAVYASDLSRARESAEILSSKTKHSVITDARLREIDFGSLTGKPFAEGEKYREIGFPDGEHYAQVAQRLELFLAELIDKHDGKTVAVVAHGGMWKVLEHLINGAPLSLNSLTAKPPTGVVRYVVQQVKHIGMDAPKGDGWAQDPDTLDTWFSSALWTFSTLGWPATTSDLETFHPTDVMETSYDIITFWVARMIMMSTYLTTEIPFHTVYLHGIVRDKQGRKMSKSLGNGIDPREMADKYGADAVRLSLIIGTTPGNDQKLSEDKIASYRNYANKLWNIARFLQMQEGGAGEWKATSLADRWLLSTLQTVVMKTTEDMEAFRFSQAGERLYDYVWHNFADWYLEVAKVEKNIPLAHHAFRTLLTLLHPFMPFVTETLWQQLGYGKDLLMIEAWPTAEKKFVDEKAEAEFTALQEEITALRKEKKAALEISKPQQEFMRPKNSLVWKHQELVETLARVTLQKS